MRTDAKRHEHETDHRAVAVGAALTLAVSLILLAAGQSAAQELPGVFVIGGLALLGCWGAMAVVERPEKRAVIRGLALGLVLGLLALLVVLGAQTVALPID